MIRTKGMQPTFMFVLTLAWAVHSALGLALVAKEGALKMGATNYSGPTQEDVDAVHADLAVHYAKSLRNIIHSAGSEDSDAPAASAPTNETSQELVQLDNGMKNTKVAKIEPILLRPNAGKGVDTVSFGMKVMNFYGTSLKKHTCHLDIVMSFRWQDPRVIDLIPEGLSELSMAWTQAVDLMWMPGMVVTNRDIEEYEIVSASVTIHTTGEVLRVERANTVVMKKFDLGTYPFDAQTLEIKIASSKYMINEVALVANNNASGVPQDGEFGLYEVVGWQTQVYDTADGSLLKSRGKLDINVERNLGKYVDDHLIPTAIILVISWSVFFFPFEKPFITPRLALSILALLQFTNLMVKSGKELPGAAPFNWNDLLNQQIQLFMFITIVLNIFTEIVCHQFEKEPEARKLNNEAKVLVPTLSAANIIIILGSAEYQTMTVSMATIVTKSSAVIIITTYFVYAFRAVTAKKEGLEEEAIAPVPITRQESA